MGFRINTNISSMNAFRNVNVTNSAMDKSLGSLSSGVRIGRASDDPSGMALANSLRSQAQALGQSIANANNGIGVVQTAEGALDEYVNIIHAIRIKAIQAASDVQSPDSRKKIQEDVDRLLEEAQSIAMNTQFNGQLLLSGGFQNKSFHTGAYAEESVNVSIKTANINEIAKREGSATGYNYTSSNPFNSSGTVHVNIVVNTADATVIDVTAGNINTTASLQTANALVSVFNTEATNLGKNITASSVDLGGGEYGIKLTSPDDNFNVDVLWASTDGTIDVNMDSTPIGGTAAEYALSEIDVTTSAGAQNAIETADRALSDIGSIRSDLGSVENRLESTIRNNATTQINIEAAESQLRDVDFAAESENFARLNIMAQSGSYALSQANLSPEGVMNLLESSA